MDFYYRRLRDMREDHDLTQGEVAKYLETTQQNYSLYESGKREIPLHLMIKLANLYHVSMDYMCGRTNLTENPNLKT